MRRILTSTLSLVLLLGVLTGVAFGQQARQAVAAKKGTYNWVRVAPDNHARVLEKIRQGSPFTVVGKSGAYYAVILPDAARGWLHESNVQFR